jgi:hypothetical protein
MAVLRGAQVRGYAERTATEDTTSALQGFGCEEL